MTAHFKKVISEQALSHQVLMEAELGTERPGLLLLKALRGASWISFSDKDGNRHLMQVHEIRQARQVPNRWVIYGSDHTSKAIRIEYDLRGGQEFSDNFRDLEEVPFGIIIQYAKQGRVLGMDGKPIQTLDGLVSIADEPWRKLIMRKKRHASRGGVSLQDIEKRIFAEPKASSAQRRNGAQSWGQKSM